MLCSSALFLQLKYSNMPDIFNSLQLQKSQQPANVLLLCCLKTLNNYCMSSSLPQLLKYTTVQVISGLLMRHQTVWSGAVHIAHVQCCPAASNLHQWPKMGIFLFCNLKALKVRDEARIFFFCFAVLKQKISYLLSAASNIERLLLKSCLKIWLLLSDESLSSSAISEHSNAQWMHTCSFSAPLPWKHRYMIQDFAPLPLQLKTQGQRQMSVFCSLQSQITNNVEPERMFYFGEAVSNRDRVSLCSAPLLFRLLYKRENFLSLNSQ